MVSPGKTTGVGFHALLQGSLPDPGIEPEALVSSALQVYSLPADPGIPRLNISPKELKTDVQTETCPGMFIAPLFT